MVNCYFPCAFFMIMNVIVEGVLPITGLYCQDPDTRKLYSINSTWPSESFCGNYTCKLRKKNVTQTEYAPVTKLNSTAQEKKQETASSDMATSPSEHASVVIKPAPPTKQPMFNKNAFNELNHITDNYKNGGSDNDRYLTQSEINTISEILHTVKKSDLDAIVEIYNIAQDIFKEMDSTTTEKNVKLTTDITNADKRQFKPKILSNEKDSVSYWYEPLYPDSVKINPTDSKIEETNSIPSVHSYPHPATYFKGPLTDKDFRKLPYYYPMSNFQRMSSYLHNKPLYNLKDYIPYPPRPCNKRYNNIPPWFTAPIKKYIPEQEKPQIMQPVLLPYPFSYIHHNNFSAYPPSFYYNTYPWAQLDPYIRSKNYPQHYFSPYYTSDPKTAVVDDVEELEHSDDHNNNVEVISSETKAEEGESPEWQTEELSAKIIEEIRAHILDSSKLSKPTLRKNIKLEKVGKVVKLDELMRTKRDTSKGDDKNIEEENIQYEPYIERTTCESNNELGFFRMGNMAEPYPACCPQKIS